MFVVLLELRCSISTRLFDSIPIFWNHTDTNEILTLRKTFASTIDEKLSKSFKFQPLILKVLKRGPYLFVLYFHIIPSVHAYICILVDDSEK